MSSRRILVVDDDQTMVQTLCDILEMRGWQTLRAYDGGEAVATVTGEAVDFVLMDVRMRQMNGVEALQKIRVARPATRVVLMTAYAAPELLLQAEREGVVRVMRKPVDLPVLLTLLGTANGHTAN